MLNMRTVGELSELASVTVRTLHHYDEIGLLSPSDRSEVGYRLYSYEDLRRLQEIIVWRQLGFSLAEIQGLLDDPDHNRVSALRRQRELVERDLERLRATARALDAALTAHERGTRPEEQTMFEGFDPYEEETRERWGHTEAYRESRRRASSYGEGEWRQIKEESEHIRHEFVELFRAGEAATGERPRAVAERHRQQISQWFYECPPQMHRGLGELFVNDSRFAQNYDKHAPGLAAYVRDAMVANADRLGVNAG